MQLNEYQEDIETKEVEEMSVAEQLTCSLRPAISVLKSSSMFHGYCGPVNAEPFPALTEFVPRKYEYNAILSINLFIQMAVPRPWKVRRLIVKHGQMHMDLYMK